MLWQPPRPRPWIRSAPLPARATIINNILCNGDQQLREQLVLLLTFFLSLFSSLFEPNFGVAIAPAACGSVPGGSPGFYLL